MKDFQFSKFKIFRADHTVIFVEFVISVLSATSKSKLTLDLRTGTISQSGNSPSSQVFQILQTEPTSVNLVEDGCAEQVLLAINFSAKSKHDYIKFELQFDENNPPKLWTFNIGESLYANGELALLQLCNDRVSQLN